MSGFTLNRVPAVAVGPGRISEIGGETLRLTGAPVSVLLVADPGLVPLGIAERVAAALAAAGHEVVLFDDFTSDPNEEQVGSGAARARELRVGAVVGLGGGSALDAAKMVAVASAADRAIESYRLAAIPLPERRTKLICAPTTAGTGSEATAVSVLSANDHTKYWYWGDPLKPDFVLLDPELTKSLPTGLTAATGLDALVHAIEAATNRNASPGSDIHALAAIRLVASNLPEAVAKPQSDGARERMLLAATAAGIAIDNAGTAIAHNIGHALGSLMPIHHGRAVAIAMQATLPWVIEGNREAFGRVAEAFGLQGADELPDRFTRLMDELHVDRSLPRAIDVATLANRMAAPENAAMLRSTAREVTRSDLEYLAARVLDATAAPKAA